MSTVITTENWDGVTAPSATITGWTVDSGWATETSVYQSSPNGIDCTPSGYKFLTYNTLDGNSGNVKATAKCYLDDSSSGDTAFAVAIRGSSDPLSSSNSFYALEAESDRSFAGTWKTRILKQISGTQTAIVSLTGLTSALPDAGWYQLTLAAYGSDFTATLVRLADGYFLQTDGTWAATAAQCLTATDSSITGQGYSGCYANGIGLNFNAVYTDDFSLSTTDAPTNQVLPRPLIVPVPFDLSRFW